MKVLIIGGFLGAGKTSVVLQLAKYIVKHSDYDSEYKVAIIENEIGEVGVDDIAFKGQGFEVQNMFAGCACCTMSGEVPIAVDKIRRELNPEWVIIESTGVAYPLSIKTTLEDAISVEGVICGVVDASRWKRFLIPMQTLLSGQLSDASTILINKVDLVNDDELSEIMESVRTYNGVAPLIPVCAEKTIDDSVWEQVLKRENA